MANHTPAPWRVDERGFHKENGEVIEQLGHSVCPHCKKKTYETPTTMQVVAKGWGICQLGSYKPKEEYEQHLANARLIAASPEMYDTLKSVEQALFDKPDHIDLYRKVRAVLRVVHQV